MMMINDDDYHNHHEAKEPKEMWLHLFDGCVKNGDGDFCPRELWNAWSNDTKRRFLNMKVVDFYGPG